MVSGLFVTGTDTGVGKTFVACAIARELKKRGIDIGVMKPVATGGKGFSRDAQLLIESAGVSDGKKYINPYCFSVPAAPFVSSQYSKQSISISKILSSYHKLLKSHDVLLVEGAGGLLVPITDRITMADLAKIMKLPLLIIARGSLGTINHTLLSVSYAHTHKLPVFGIIINHIEPVRSIAQKTVTKTIQQFTDIPVLGEIKYSKSKQCIIPENIIRKLLALH